MKLLLSALIKFTCGAAAVGLLIFLPAGTLAFPGGWLLVFACYPAIIIVRLKDEEALLTRELPGYAEYKQKVKYRILPFVW